MTEAGMDSQDSLDSQGSNVTIIEEDREEILYFAYGSNLSTAQMLDRCPFATAIGLGFLPGWRWHINERGYANVLPPASTSTDGGGGGVYGLLYLLPPRDEARLDGFEGVASGAYGKVHRTLRWVRDADGKPLPGAAGQEVQALVYVDDKRTGPGVPRDEYVRRMERGIDDAVRNWGMDEGYADRVMRKWWKTTAAAPGT